VFDLRPIIWHKSANNRAFIYIGRVVVMVDNSVELRQEVFTSDAWRIIDWLEDDEVTKYLNEGQNVCESIREIIYRINMPILTHLFNQNGSFFMVTTSEKEPIGFLRLVPKGKRAEMVIVIGDREKWNKGFGTNAIAEGLKHAFFEWRVDEVIAKINFNNEYSKRAFKKLGFTEDKELSKEIQYSLSMKDFLEQVS
jgi:RimJ/RimL family protein N-acetyltransferase